MSNEQLWGGNTKQAQAGWKLFSISRPDCEAAPVVSAETAALPDKRRPRSTRAHGPGSPLLPPDTTDILACFHLSFSRKENKSSSEFVPLAASTPPSPGWPSQPVTAWCGLRGCHVGCLPPLSGSSQGSTETVKRGLSPALPIITRHSHLHSFPTPSFIHLFLFQCFCLPLRFFFSSRFLSGKKKKDPNGAEGEVTDTQSERR